MRHSARSLLLLLPLFVCACSHKTVVTQAQPMAPPIPDAAPPPKSDAATAANLTGLELKNFPTAPPKVVVTPPEPAKNPKRKKTPKSSSPPSMASNNNTQTAQVAPESQHGAVSAMGTLTAGEPDTQKKQTQDDIAGVEKSLNSIGRKLSDTEEKTAVQIREYLKQARTALDTNDVDGANTLTKKAKFLLTELTE